MPTVKDFLDFLNEIAPKNLAEDWDNPGLNVGRLNKEVKKVIVALDPSYIAICEAKDAGADLLVTHHPSVFSPVRQVTDESLLGRDIIEMIKADISHICAHTNYDSAQG